MTQDRKNIKKVSICLIPEQAVWEAIFAENLPEALEFLDSGVANTVSSRFLLLLGRVCQKSRFAKPLKEAPVCPKYIK